MFQNQDLRKIFNLKPQDLQYLIVGKFIDATDTLSKGPRGRRLFDLSTTYSVGIMSALRNYRIDFRIGHILTQALRDILEDFTNNIAHHIPIPMYQMAEGYQPFENLNIPNLDYYVDFKDRKWLGIHLKIPGKGTVSFFDWAYELNLMKQGKHKDHYQIQKVDLNQNSGDTFWTQYETLISLNLVHITRRIKTYVNQHPSTSPTPH